MCFYGTRFHVIIKGSYICYDYTKIFHYSLNNIIPPETLEWLLSMQLQERWYCTEGRFYFIFSLKQENCIPPMFVCISVLLGTDHLINFQWRNAYGTNLDYTKIATEELQNACFKMRNALDNEIQKCKNITSIYAPRYLVTVYA